MNIINKKLTDLKPYKKNPRKNDEAVPFVANSIKEFGFKVPIVIDKNNEIIAGHTRYKAAQSLGLEEVPCIIADDLTPEQVKAFRLADNKVGELAEWDFKLLDDELEEILSIDMTEYGFIDETEPVTAAEDEYQPEADEDAPKSKYGDLYRLGTHYLLCGDATKKEDLERLLQGNKADLALTDPPYGISVVKKDGTVGGDRKGGSGVMVKSNTYHAIKGDNTTETAKKHINLLKDYAKEQIIFGGNYFTDFLPASRCWLVWDKVNGDTDFADCELAWTSFKTSARIYSQKYKDVEEGWTDGSHIYKWMWNGVARQGNRKEELPRRVHPTQKPVGLLGEILNDFSQEGDTIIDCFGGSGSTLIACEQLTRYCYMMEYEPFYIDLIIDRWERYTGLKAELISQLE